MTKKLGARFNKNKTSWWAFPLFLFRPVIEVGHQGAQKYGNFNFLSGQKVSTLYDSAMRHLDKFMDPTQPDIDEESGCHHLAHCAWNIITMCYMVTKRKGLDDRWKGSN